MNNSKNTEKQKNDGAKKNDLLKNISGCKHEAESLALSIKKSLSLALNLKSQLKQKLEKINATLLDEKQKEEQRKLEEEKQKAEQAKQEAEKAEQAKQEKVSKPQAKQPLPKYGKPFEPNLRTRHFNDNSQESSSRPNWNKNDSSKPSYNRNQNGNQASSKPNTQQGYKNQQSATTSAPQYDVQLKNQNNKSQSNKKKQNEKSHEEKKGLNKKALVMRGFVADESLENEDGIFMGSRKRRAKSKPQQVVVAPKIEHAVITTENLTVKLLAEKIGKPVVEIIKKFMILGNMVNINSNIDFDSAELIASELGVTLEQKIEKTYEEKLTEIYNEVDAEENLVKRPPIVTVLGHVDHGKTSLLDYIRETNVIAGEAGGITQHIGAYTIEKNKELITFIDTPGHAAFTNMRERGAKLTDIAILVVAADDGIMPQTVEAIKHIKQVKAPMIVAINKIDKPEANIERVKQQLTEYDVIPEEWGGDAIIIPISAKFGQNVDKLLDMVLFVAEYQNLRANPNRKAVGSVIEARLDKGMGAVTTILVQNGTLKVGDVIIAGTSAGRVRAMLNEKGKNVKSAGPSFAVSVLGLSSVPSAGDEMYAVDEKMGKKVLSERMVKQKTDLIKTADNSVDALMDRFKETEYKSYNVIIKADVQGSLEALTQSLGAIMNEEVKVRCIHGGVGAVNENDIMLASASNAVIIAFNTKLDFKAKVLGEKYKITTKNFRIIYEAVDFVTEQINLLKTPKYREVISGKAEIRVIFKASKVGAIAGSYILEGKISKGQQARVMRKGKEVYNGNIATIQREKNEVKEIVSGFECGIVLNNFSAIEEGDIIEAINKERIN